MGAQLDGQEREGGAAREVISALSGLHKTTRANELRVCLLAALGVEGAFAPAGAVLWKEGRGYVHLVSEPGRAPILPSGFDLRTPVGKQRLLLRASPTRCCASLQSPDEVLGIVELDWPKRPRDLDRTAHDAELLRLTSAVKNLWHQHDGRVGAGAYAVLTPDGRLDAACRRGRAILRSHHLDRLRAAIARGPLPTSTLLGPLRARLSLLDGGRRKRILVKLEQAVRLPVAHELLLSPRQREVALMAAKGVSAIQIARDLGLAEPTVKTHLQLAYRLLDCDNRIALRELLKHLL